MKQRARALIFLSLMCTSAALNREEDDVVTKADAVLSEDVLLTETEKMLVKEEQVLEKLYKKIAPKQQTEAFNTKDTVRNLKDFLNTFDERPRLETRGMLLIVKLGEE